MAFPRRLGTRGNCGIFSTKAIESLLSMAKIGYCPPTRNGVNMEQISFIRLVEKHFEYLIDEYGFDIAETRHSPENFGNGLVRFQSSEVNITIILDRGQILIDLGPRSVAPNQCFDLRAVVMFLEPQITEPIYLFPDNTNGNESREWHITRLARLLRQYCAQILEGRFSNWEELRQFTNKAALETYRNITGRDPIRITSKKGIASIQEELERRRRKSGK